MDSDDDKSADFQFGSSQESEIGPPLVIDSVWDCPGITLDTINDDDGKTIMGCIGNPVFVNRKHYYYTSR
jgi:hypothetical protein